jgi:hypothetical protein
MYDAVLGCELHVVTGGDGGWRGVEEREGGFKRNSIYKSMISNFPCKKQFTDELRDIIVLFTFPLSLVGMGSGIMAHFLLICSS